MAFQTSISGSFSVKAYIGDYKILLGFDFSDSSKAKNLAGFTINCQPPIGPSAGRFGRSLTPTPSSAKAGTPNRPMSTEPAGFSPPTRSLNWPARSRTLTSCRKCRPARSKARLGNTTLSWMPAGTQTSESLRRNTRFKRRLSTPLGPRPSCTIAWLASGSTANAKLSIFMAKSYQAFMPPANRLVDSLCMACPGSLSSGASPAGKLPSLRPEKYC
jgi:hypothetical protein